MRVWRQAGGLPDQRGGGWMELYSAALAGEGAVGRVAAVVVRGSGRVQTAAAWRRAVAARGFGSGMVLLVPGEEGLAQMEGGQRPADQHRAQKGNVGNR